ncbi:hypothetical protein QJU43_05090 [Pasteurella atlantica]|uniref:Uncharacterized protein n=2 Tax=Pasteurellaceae TaxID=712 RepID=A0ACC6HJU9_9PAST|nr:hypothetical protein [Pasteurella atlantica]MDP8034260.1 hypothetical protein [Pasteurella atlantica]MDP8036193.1 hypothetical protein [Pasteurella atlantica]MDP8038143.1 hypothetical protein [Pasteurella atlantica]MDP8048498.1 hypothetical protein [Pasteurella atlantica]MDP8050437.1 hypothetical protein [Pasteurella atlantica]
MNIYATYATNLEIVEARKKIEILSGLALQERESLYFGVYYCVGDKYDGQSFQLHHNRDFDDNEPLKDVPFSVLLEVSRLSVENEKLFATLDDFHLIHKEYL